MEQLFLYRMESQSNSKPQFPKTKVLKTILTSKLFNKMVVECPPNRTRYNLICIHKSNVEETQICQIRDLIEMYAEEIRHSCIKPLIYSQENRTSIELIFDFSHTGTLR
jgi:hypothetical protein